MPEVSIDAPYNQLLGHEYEGRGGAHEWISPTQSWAVKGFPALMVLGPTSSPLIEATHLARNQHEVERKFALLRERWQRETAVHSVAVLVAMHDAYQQIIGLGPEVVPLILRVLAEDGSPNWFWALHAITGEDAASGIEDVPSAVLAWLDWGRRKGYAD